MNDNKILKIESGDLTLRDKTLDDLNDYIKWNTVLTEWQNWDGPWEKKDKFEIEKYKEEWLSNFNKPLPEIRSRLEICVNGIHIGWVGSYKSCINHLVQVDRIESIKNTVGKVLAIGIDIPNQEFRGKGIGTKIFKMWLEYLIKEHNSNAIYTETWSGNKRMIATALKCGFKEISRLKDKRVVNGKFYDALRFEKVIK